MFVCVNPVFVKANKICKKYAGVIEGARMGKNTVGSKYMCHKGRVSHTHGQAAIMHSQLEADYSIPLGLGECAGTLTGTDERPSAESGSRRASSIPRTGGLHDRRAFKTSSKRDSCPCPQPTADRELHLSDVPGAKKDGSHRPIVDLRISTSLYSGSISRWKESI